MLHANAAKHMHVLPFSQPAPVLRALFSALVSYHQRTFKINYILRALRRDGESYRRCSEVAGLYRRLACEV